MPTKKELEREAKEKAQAIKVSGNDIADVFSALDSAPVESRAAVPGYLDLDDEESAQEADPAVSADFQSLQQELAEIRRSRAKLSQDMEASDLDKDERDTLKARGTLLDSRERSAREELKLFHKNELSELGQVRKVRIVIEDYLSSEPSRTVGAL